MIKKFAFALGVTTICSNVHPTFALPKSEVLDENLGGHRIHRTLKTKEITRKARKISKKRARKLRIAQRRADLKKSILESRNVKAQTSMLKAQTRKRPRLKRFQELFARAISKKMEIRTQRRLAAVGKVFEQAKVDTPVVAIKQPLKLDVLTVNQPTTPKAAPIQTILPMIKKTEPAKLISTPLEIPSPKNIAAPTKQEAVPANPTQQLQPKIVAEQEIIQKNLPEIIVQDKAPQEDMTLQVQPKPIAREEIVQENLLHPVLPDIIHHDEISQESIARHDQAESVALEDIIRESRLPNVMPELIVQDEDPQENIRRDIQPEFVSLEGILRESRLQNVMPELIVQDQDPEENIRRDIQPEFVVQEEDAPKAEAEVSLPENISVKEKIVNEIESIGMEFSNLASNLVDATKQLIQPIVKVEEDKDTTPTNTTETPTPTSMNNTNDIVQSEVQDEIIFSRIESSDVNKFNEDMNFIKFFVARLLETVNEIKEESYNGYFPHYFGKGYKVALELQEGKVDNFLNFGDEQTSQRFASLETFLKDKDGLGLQEWIEARNTVEALKEEFNDKMLELTQIKSTIFNLMVPQTETLTPTADVTTSSVDTPTLLAINIPPEEDTKETALVNTNSQSTTPILQEESNGYGIFETIKGLIGKLLGAEHEKTLESKIEAVTILKDEALRLSKTLTESQLIRSAQAKSASEPQFFESALKNSLTVVQKLQEAPEKNVAEALEDLRTSVLIEQAEAGYQIIPQLAVKYFIDYARIIIGWNKPVAANNATVVNTNDQNLASKINEESDAMEATPLEQTYMNNMVSVYLDQEARENGLANNNNNNNNNKNIVSNRNEKSNKKAPSTLGLTELSAKIDSFLRKSSHEKLNDPSFGEVLKLHAIYLDAALNNKPIGSIDEEKEMKNSISNVLSTLRTSIDNNSENLAEQGISQKMINQIIGNINGIGKFLFGWQENQ